IQEIVQFESRGRAGYPLCVKAGGLYGAKLGKGLGDFLLGKWVGGGEGFILVVYSKGSFFHEFFNSRRELVINHGWVWRQLILHALSENFHLFGSRVHKGVWKSRSLPKFPQSSSLSDLIINMFSKALCPRVLSVSNLSKCERLRQDSKGKVCTKWVRHSDKQMASSNMKQGALSSGCCRCLICQSASGSDKTARTGGWSHLAVLVEASGSALLRPQLFYPGVMR
ncbi:hypothetical protein J6590_105633, partial [Homalodisca vitripennis]